MRERVLQYYLLPHGKQPKRILMQGVGAFLGVCLDAKVASFWLCCSASVSFSPTPPHTAATSFSSYS
jgi:hypothetical protein